VNTEFFIAKRIFFEKADQKKFSRSIISFATFGIALGLSVMILAIAIILGFKKEIRGKVIGFASHIQIVNYDSNSSYETAPINANQPFLATLQNMDGVISIQQFSTKPGIIKTEEEIQGVVLKGIGPDFDWNFFQQYLVEGNTFLVTDSTRGNDVIISQQIANLLKLKVGEKFIMSFLNENSNIPRNRVFKICGIYKTSLEEFDKLFILADIGHIRKLNNWEEGEISGYEVFLSDFDQISEKANEVRDQIFLHQNEQQDFLRVVDITQKYPQIFDWLNLMDMNVWVILILITLVAGFNMVSALLILILERTNMIGILKSLGIANYNIRKIFLYLSGLLIAKGLLIGNIIGFSLSLLQKYFGFIRLDPTSYYVETVPIEMNLPLLTALNLLTMLLTIAMLVIPSFFISKITPDKAIRFD